MEQDHFARRISCTCSSKFFRNIADGYLRFAVLSYCVKIHDRASDCHTTTINIASHPYYHGTKPAAWWSDALRRSDPTIRAANAVQPHFQSPSAAIIRIVRRSAKSCITTHLWKNIICCIMLWLGSPYSWSLLTWTLNWNDSGRSGTTQTVNRALYSFAGSLHALLLSCHLFRSRYPWASTGNAISLWRRLSALKLRSTVVCKLIKSLKWCKGIQMTQINHKPLISSI